MKVAAILLAILAMASGLGAAWYWRESTKVQIDPGWGLPGSGRPTEPVDQDASNTGWIVATLDAFTASSEFNRKAAGWTAVSVGLSAASAFLSALAN